MSRGVAFAVLALVGSPLAAEEPKGKGLLDLNAQWSRGKAEGKGPVRFTHAPMALEGTDRIIPYGLMVGGHVCPIDHQ